MKVAFDAQCKQTVECHAYEEGHEVDLDIAAVVGRHLETLVVNAICGWYQNKKGAYEVGEYQMSEQEIWLVDFVEASDFEQRGQECKVDQEAHHQVDRTNDW